MKKYILLFGVLCILLACASSNKATQAEIDRLQAILNNKSFEIESEWAQPQATYAMTQLANAGMLPIGSDAGNINLVGNANYFRVKGDSISAFLPYFGERQSGGGYGSTSGGIEFEGLPNNYTVDAAKNDSYVLKFSIRDKNTTSENYNVIVRVFPNLSSTIFVNSSQKRSIRYRGRIVNTELE